MERKTPSHAFSGDYSREQEDSGLIINSTNTLSCQWYHPLVPIIHCWQAVRKIKQTTTMRQKKASNFPFLAETLEMF